MLHNYIGAIREVCDRFQERVYKVSQNLTFIKRMRVNYMFDKKKRLTFLWGDSLRIEPVSVEEKNKKNELYDAPLKSVNTVRTHCKWKNT